MSQVCTCSLFLPMNEKYHLSLFSTLDISKTISWYPEFQFIWSRLYVCVCEVCYYLIKLSHKTILQCTVGVNSINSSIPHSSTTMNTHAYIEDYAHYRGYLGLTRAIQNCSNHIYTKCIYFTCIALKQTKAMKPDFTILYIFKIEVSCSMQKLLNICTISDILLYPYLLLYYLAFSIHCAMKIQIHLFIGEICVLNTSILGNSRSICTICVCYFFLIYRNYSVGCDKCK